VVKGNGDTFKRREVSPGVYQCGCHWVRLVGWGDVLRECLIHHAAGAARLAAYERKQKERKCHG